MLISISQKKKFIFVANTKTASTSIENVLADYSHISIIDPPTLKHMGYRKITKNFKFIFSYPGMSINSFYKFGVIRDPVDWLVSWFNYRSREQISDPKHSNYRNYTGNMSFEEFIDSVVAEGKIQPQSNLFVDSNGHNAMDFIIRYENLESDFNYVMQKIGLSLQMPHKNKSENRRLKDRDVEYSTLLKIKEAFSRDYQFIEETSTSISLK